MARGPYQRLEFTVLQVRHVREHVMLDLVVEPAVHDVDEVRARLEVHAGVGAAEQELGATALAGGAEAVKIIASMVAGHDDEGVRVGHQFCDDRETPRELRGVLARFFSQVVGVA